MDDRELTRAWGTLESTMSQRRRIEHRVFEWLEAGRTSLAAEWLELIKVTPVAGLGFAAVGALALLLATPLGWVLSAALP